MSANTAICVRLLIALRSFLLTCLRSLNTTLTSTCSISRLYGVPRVTRNMTEKSVFMLTTGKTSAENLTSTSMRKSSVLTGTRKSSARLTTQTARWSTAASKVTGGKSKNTIRTTTKQVSARPSLATKVTVLTTTMRVKKGNQWTQTSK